MTGLEILGKREAGQHTIYTFRLLPPPPYAEQLKSFQQVMDATEEDLKQWILEIIKAFLAK